MLYKRKKWDIVLALCQYGIGNVWEWGNESGGQLWRTEGDVYDSWESVHNAFNKLSDKAASLRTTLDNAEFWTKQMEDGQSGPGVVDSVQ